MVQYKTGDLLSEDAEAIVNAVNCVGVMGRGIALQYKKAFPENFKAYAAACNREEVLPGKMFVHETEGLTNPKYIINFPTKRHWRGASRIEDIASGLEALAREIKLRNIRSIAIPPLGAGLGGLHWPDVRQLIERSLDNLDGVQVIVFEPQGVPPAREMARSRKIPKMTPGRAALVGLMHRYLNGLLDPFLTLLEIHKLMYFMQEAGEQLKLQYKKAAYGPYAENLRHVLSTVEGYMTSGYADGGDAPDKPIHLVPGAIEDAEIFLSNHAETKQRFDRVSELVEGFESAFGLELLATVLWVVKHENPTSSEDIERRVHSWSERKKRFTSRQISIAIDVLTKKGWISV